MRRRPGVKNRLQAVLIFKSMLGLGAFDRARRRKGLSEVHLKVLDEKRKQYSPVL